MGNLKAQFESEGYLVIEGFNNQEECDALMNRGETLANNFDFKGHPSVFQTTEQTKTTDDYFLHFSSISIDFSYSSFFNPFF